MHSTNYNEEDAVNEVAKRRQGQVSVMNAALPQNPMAGLEAIEEKKTQPPNAKRNPRKRMRNDADYVPEDPSNTYSPGTEPPEEVMAKMRSDKTNPVIMSK